VEEVKPEPRAHIWLDVGEETWNIYLARAPREMSRTEAPPECVSDLDQYPRCEDSRTSRQVPRSANAPNPIVLPPPQGRPARLPAQPVQSKSRIGLSVGLAVLAGSSICWS